MSELRVVGFDPSLNNWGIAQGLYCTDRGTVQITDLYVTQPVIPKGKQVRQNSKDLLASYQLAESALEAVADAQAIFVEVPVGSQSARAMASYGVCVGILGALRAFNIPFFELTPTEIKMVATGTSTASKRLMIDWAQNFHPEAIFPTYIKNGEKLIVESKAEHMADAIAAIHAGIQSDAFKQLMQLRA